MSDVIKVCPICKKKPKIDDLCGSHWLSCDGCMMTTRYQNSIEEAIIVWNKLPAIVKIEELEAELITFCERCETCEWYFHELCDYKDKHRGEKETDCRHDEFIRESESKNLPSLWLKRKDW